MFLQLSLKNFLLSVISACLIIYLVFFFKTDLTHYRVFRELWNLGHVILFFGYSYVFCKKLRPRYLNSLVKEFVFIIISSVLIGASIEFIQSFTGRDESGFDVVLDLLGASIGYVIFSEKLSNSRLLIKNLFYSLTIIFIISTLYPMTVVIIDDIHQRLEFPILVSNKSINEISRFTQSNVKLDLVMSDFESSKNKLLRIDFNKGQYPTASLGSFPMNWIGYNYLSFRVFNPSKTFTDINIRIHDRDHKKSNFDFHDRFNYRIRLFSGWTDVKINLDDVRKAPLRREMQMDKIDEIMFFKINVRQPVYLLFSQIILDR